MVEMLDGISLLKTRVDVVQFLIERDGDFCYLCGKSFEKLSEDHWEDYTIDHVIPKSRGGLDHVTNYKLAHFPCNQEKDDRLFLEDGTLEPKRKSKRVQKGERPDYCTTCLDGRRLSKGAHCPSCGHEAGPPQWPWFAKRSAYECNHDHETWCWGCGIGIFPRSSEHVDL
jgi:HNH endonuclease